VPCAIARRISDVTAEYRSTRHGRDRSTDKFASVLPFCVIVLFDPKLSLFAMLHPANQWRQSHGAVGPNELAARLPDVAGLDLCETIATFVQALFLSCKGSDAPTLGTMGAQTFFLICAERTSVSADPASGERLLSRCFPRRLDLRANA
jgi:hypothetical protein